MTWRRVDDLAAELDDIAARFDERKDDRGAANARVIAIMRQSVEKVVAAIDRMER
ncbi:MAG TPA: hypothetical protein VHU82_07535 [Vicinamibacterales bacterium]|nr:hypothetical protein [Vicinamibacterales bacterium]